MVGRTGSESLDVWRNIAKDTRVTSFIERKNAQGKSI